MCTARYTDCSGMGGHFLLLILCLLLCESLSLTCLPREYIVNNVCCPMCDKGLFVKTHCTTSSSACVVCADGTFMDHPNGLTECFRCRECDTGGNLIVKQKCTTTSNTVCECKAGHFCESDDCDICQEHTLCTAGQYVKEPGTGRSNSVCEDCPPDHFSDKNNSAHCNPWRKCSELGLVLYEKGTSITDSICKAKRSHILALVAFGLLAVFTVGLAGLTFMKSQEKNELHKGNDPFKLPLSKEEEGTMQTENENRDRDGT